MEGKFEVDDQVDDVVMVEACSLSAEGEDDENCWDCGINVVEEEDGGEMCTDCRRTLCWDCTGGRLRAFRSPHKDGREEDNGRCGATVRVL